MYDQESDRVIGAVDFIATRLLKDATMKALRLIVGVAALIYAVILIKYFATGVSCLCLLRIVPSWFHLVIWTLGPPLWFALEYWLMRDTQERKDGRLKDGQEVAGKIWAAVLVVLLYFYPDGPLHMMSQIIHPPNQKHCDTIQPK
jgi:hypothetical protein